MFSIAYIYAILLLLFLCLIILSTALRVHPAVIRLTVYRWLYVFIERYKICTYFLHRIRLENSFCQNIIFFHKIWAEYRAVKGFGSWTIFLTTIITIITLAQDVQLLRIPICLANAKVVSRRENWQMSTRCCPAPTRCWLVATLPQLQNRQKPSQVPRLAIQFGTRFNTPRHGLYRKHGQRFYNLWNSVEICRRRLMCVAE